MTVCVSYKQVSKIVPKDLLLAETDKVDSDVRRGFVAGF
jgi:hypothetical protein